MECVRCGEVADDDVVQCPRCGERELTSSMVVSGNGRAAGNNYYESTRVHAPINAPNSTIVVALTHAVAAAVGPEIGYCNKCQHAIWIHAAVCRHCGFDPAIEAAQQKARTDGALMLFAFGWLGASAVVYQLLELIGLTSMATSAVGGFLIVLAVALYVMWPHDRDDG